MDDVVAQTIARINAQIEKTSAKQGDRLNYCQLLNTIRDDLAVLFSLVPSTDDLIRLFCRRLARLMQQNQSLKIEAWLELHQELLCVLQRNTIPVDKLKYTRFASLLKLEGLMEGRQAEFQRTIGKSKSLDELVERHRDFLDRYLRKCLSLHSTLEIRNLIENVEGFLHHGYQQNDIQLRSETKERLQQSLGSLDIPLECSYKNLLRGCSTKYFSQAPGPEEANTPSNTFLPRMEEIRISSDYGIVEIYARLEESPWIVILGDPGSAKTTTMRLLTQHFAAAALRGHQRVWINGIDCGPRRVPILIRIEEFAKWLNEHHDMAFIDYIGKHTWFSESYHNDDDDECALKELIYHGHALILLDGLNEIPLLEQRSEIVQLIRQLIREHVQDRQFLSAFDDLPEDLISRFQGTPPSSMSAGNQIIVTSRIVGYSLNALAAPRVTHYLVSPMNDTEASRFVHHWFQSVAEKVHDTVLTEGLHLDIETLKRSTASRQRSLTQALRDAEDKLTLHPRMLSMICSTVFNLSDELLLPKSMVQLFHLIIHSAIRNLLRTQSNIPENVLWKFHTDLALYFHLHSSAGLIDEFDIRCLSHLIIKQHHLSSNGNERRQQADELMSLISASDTMVVERELKVLSFVDTSFQEYFVASFLLQAPTIDDIARNFLTYGIRPRFRESIRLALCRISWMWPARDYYHFCKKLVAPARDYVIPLGALLLLINLRSVKCVPSPSVIFRALDRLLDHSSQIFFVAYLAIYFPVLAKRKLIQWMQRSLINEMRVSKFCKSLLLAISLVEHRQLWQAKDRLLAAICEQLWSLHSISSSVASTVTRTLRHVSMSSEQSQPISTNALSQYLLSHSTRDFAIHPLVLSTIIALCGGVKKTKNEIKFSAKYMFRNSSACDPIVEYLAHANESPSHRVEELVERYETVLRASAPEETSNGIIDAFTALICLRGVSQPSVYNQFRAHLALPLAIERFEQVLFFLRSNDRLIWTRTQSSLFAEVQFIMHLFVSQPARSDDQCDWFLSACLEACDRLGIEWVSHLSSFESFFHEHVGQYGKFSSGFRRLIKYFYKTVLSKQGEHIFQEPMDSALIDVRLFKMVDDQTSLILNFVPDSLERLYRCDAVPLVVLLAECLIFLTDHLESGETFITLNELLPLFKQHNLENYVLALFWMGQSRYKRKYPQVEVDFFAQYPDKFSLAPELLIVEETNHIEARTTDVHLFGASLSLARLSQVSYRDAKDAKETDAIDTNFLTRESQPILLAIRKMTDPVLRLIASSVILDMSHPSILNEEEGDLLKSEIIELFNGVLPTLTLPTSALLFVRCQLRRPAFPCEFEQFASTIGRQLLTSPTDNETNEHKIAAYVALEMINDSNLAPFLTEFTQRMTNRTDLLERNSVLFHDYFIEAESLANVNDVLLSAMYLSELAADARTLESTANIQLSLTPETLRQRFMNSEKVITSEAAIFIQNCLESGHEEDLTMINAKIFAYHTVQNDACSVILQWFNIPNNRMFTPSIYYAALLLAKQKFSVPTLISHLDKLRPLSIDERFNRLIRDFLQLESIDSPVLRGILIPLIEDAHRCSLRPGASVRCTETMSSILHLELARLASSSGNSKSFFLLLNGCSLDVQLVLSEHLLATIDSDHIKEQYLAHLVSWVIEQCAFQAGSIADILYQRIVSFLHNRQFPRITEVILISIKNVFMKMSKNNIFTNEDIPSLLETTIHSYVQGEEAKSDDVLAACLCTYGFSIPFWKRYWPNRSVPKEILALLNRLFETSSSPIVIARAGQCLILIELYLARGSVTNWLSRKNLTSKQIYDVFTRLTFDERRFIPNDRGRNPLDDVLLTKDANPLPTFITELYDNLQKTFTNCNLREQTFNYTYEAALLCRTHLGAFRVAMERCNFNEQQLKTALYRASQTRDNRFLQQCVELYTCFGDLTSEFIDMMLDMNDVHFAGWRQLANMKRISLDRETVEKLYEALESSSQQKCATKLLVHLAQIDFVSALEVSQRIADIISKLSADTVYNHRSNYEHFFTALLELSCVSGESRCSQVIREMENQEWKYSDL